MLAFHLALTTVRLRVPVRKAIFVLLLLVFASASGVSAAQAAAPSNDNFASAITISGSTGAVSASNVDATIESGEPNLSSQIGADTGTGASVWYRWTSPRSGSTVINTRGSQYDTTLAVFTGSLLSNLSVIGSNDDISEFESGGGLSSQVTFTAVAGTTYLIQLGGFNSRSGIFQLNWGPAVSLPSSPPQNGWWWSPTESGRGYSLEVNGSNVFMATYMYRTNGTSVWYVGTGTISGSTVSMEFKEYMGGGTLDSSFKPASEVGTVAVGTLVFSSSVSAKLTFSGGTLGSSTSAIEIVRYAFDGQSVQSAGLSGAPQTGWYWNADESGTGYFIEMQGAAVFMAAYMYDADGTARWYTASGTALASGSGVVLTGTLVEFANGQSLGGTYRAPALLATKGSITLQVSSSTSAVLILPSGRQVALSRFQF